MLPVAFPVQADLLEHCRDTSYSEGMDFMTEPQVWVLMGLFSAIMLGGLTLSTTLMMNAMRSGLDAIRETMDARFIGVDGRFEAMDARFASLESKMDARFEAVNTKLEHLDRDVTALSRKVFGVAGD